MDNWIFSTSIGVALVAVGIGLMRWHLRVRNARKNGSAQAENDGRYHASQFRRRMQASGFLVAIGILVPIGDAGVIPWRLFPVWIAVYWGIVLLLAMWVIVLGVADVIATSAHSRAALGRIRRQQRELENQVAEFRRRSTNGRDSSSVKP